MGHKTAAKRILTQNFHSIKNFIGFTSKILSVPSCFLGIKQLGLKLTKLSCSAEVKNEWSCTSSLPVCLHVVDRDKCTFLRTENKHRVKPSAWFRT